MLQFITQYPSALTIPEQIEKMIHAGIHWVEISAPGMSEKEMDQVATAITPMCKKTDTFVVMRNHLHLAARHRFHGILLDHRAQPRKVRNELGGEAIIGVAVDSLQALMDQRYVDIDYVVLPVSASTFDADVATVVEAREKGFDKPIVAQGDFTIDQMQALRGAGFTGFALTETLLNAPDPATLIDTIQKEV